MLTYRPHIDGLRAIAVLSVLVYHLEESLLPGGFVGVDIFFVISGFLITKLIVKELDESGSFSFRDFYIRRTRRLLPAMLTTFILCYVPAFILFSPQHLAEFATSTIYAVLSISNFYFWDTAGYFDSASSFKPLLHTWSLAVEEQFYFAWPLTLVLLFKLNNRKILTAFVVLMAIASLALNEFFFNNQTLIGSWFEVENYRSTLDINASAFYLIPFRVYEFAIGASLIFIRVERFGQKVTLPLFCSGLAFIAYSLFYFDGKMNFPSYFALLPCIGAAMIILSGSHHAFARLLTNPLAVGLGLISYSLYLVHWPVIVFYKYTMFKEMTNVDYAWILGLSLVLASLSYRFIEQPFRKPKGVIKAVKPNKKFLLGSAFAALVVCSVSVNAYVSKGWTWRYPEDVLAQLTMSAGDYANLPSEGEAFYEGDFAHNGKPKLLVIGDSMAADFINAVVEGGSFRKLDITGIMINNNCKSLFPLPERVYLDLFFGGAEVCKQEHKRVLELEDRMAQADTVILASHWWDARFQVFIERTARYLRGLGVKNVMVLGMKVQRYEGVHLLANHPLSQLKKMRTQVSPSTVYHNQILRNFAKNYVYFDLLDQFCNEEGCLRVTEDGYLTVFDAVHMTPQGAAYVGRNFEQLAWFKQILASAPAPVPVPNQSNSELAD